MRDWILAAEAEECRLLAVELVKRPEAPFLLHLALAFDRLTDSYKDRPIIGHRRASTPFRSVA